MFCLGTGPAPSPLFFDLKPALLAWEAFVSLSLLGYGWQGLRWAGNGARSCGPALCTGISFWLLLGGWLCLFHAASRAVLIGCFAPGLLLFALQCVRAWDRQRLRRTLRAAVPKNKVAGIAGVIILCFFLLCFLTRCSNFTWNKIDDVQGYMALAEKTSALHGLQPDPFSERRLASSVGGAIFLNATMLAGAGPQSMDFIDGALSLLALLLCLRAMAKTFGLSAGAIVAVFYAAAFFTLGRVNLTIINFSAAVFLCILLLFAPTPPGEAQPDFSIRNAVLPGLWAGAAFTVKSTNIPICGMLLCAFAMIYSVRQRSLRPAGFFSIALLTSALVFLPWGMQQWANEGTALFPSLGRGYHLTAYGFPSIASTVPLSVSLAAASYHVVLPALAGCLMYALLRGRPRPELLAFFAIAALYAPLFSVSIAAESINRYLLPTENLCALLFVMALLSSLRSAQGKAWLWPAGALLAGWALLFLHIGRGLYRDLADVFQLFGKPVFAYDFPVLRPQDIAARSARVRRAQQSVPPGATLLEDVQAAYGFDWRRNPVLIADYPGMASLPPGLPLDGSADDVRSYLLSYGVHYFVLDRELLRNTGHEYAEFRDRPRIEMDWRDLFRLSNRKTVHGYARMENTVSNRTQDLLLALAGPRNTIFNDGRLEVVCLDTPKGTPPAGDEH